MSAFFVMVMNFFHGYELKDSLFDRERYSVKLFSISQKNQFSRRNSGLERR